MSRRLSFCVDEESLTAAGERGDRAREGLFALAVLADPNLRERLRREWAAERSNGDRLALVKLALRARLGDCHGA
jgi:hypothetical protein